METLHVKLSLLAMTRYAHTRSKHTHTHTHTNKQSSKLLKNLSYIEWSLTCLLYLLGCVHRPNYLILDEPTNHLDVETVEAMGKALDNIKVCLIRCAYVGLHLDHNPLPKVTLFVCREV